MSKVILVTFISVLAIVPLVSFAQANMQRFMLDPNNMDYISKGGAYYLNQQPIEKEIEGTPYLYEDWVEGKIISDKNEELTNCRVRYNASSDVFEIRMDKDNRVRTLNTKRIKTVIAGVNEFTVDGEGYYQILEKGTYSLLKKYKAELKEEPYVAGLSSKHENPKWSMSKKYFVRDSSKVVMIFSGRKELLKIFNKLQDKELDKKVRSVDFSDEHKLEDLFLWLNSHKSL